MDNEVCYLRREKDAGLLHTLFFALRPEASDGGVLRAWKAVEHRLGKPLIVLLDQVEEVFTRPNKHQATELEQFLVALGDLFSRREDRPQGRIILAFRKEWLPEITKSLSNRRLPHTGVFLDRLDRRGVLEAIQLSAHVREHYGLQLNNEAAEAIATDLLDDMDSPVAPTLQVLLSTMWDAAREISLTSIIFNDVMYSRIKKEGVHLQDFLDRQLSAIGAIQPDFVQSGLAIDVLMSHTSDIGTGKQCSKAELEFSYSHNSNCVFHLIQLCKDAYLIAEESGDRPSPGHSSRLAHDALAPLVRKLYGSSDRPGQRARRVLESGVREWSRENNASLLAEWALKVVDDGLEGMRQRTEIEDKLIAASRRHLEDTRVPPLDPGIFPAALRIRKYQPNRILEVYSTHFSEDKILQMMLVAACLVIIGSFVTFIVLKLKGSPTSILGLLATIVLLVSPYGRRERIRFRLDEQRGYVISPPYFFSRPFAEKVQLGEYSCGDEIRYILYYRNRSILDTKYGPANDERKRKILIFYRSLNRSLGFIAEAPVAMFVGGASVWSKLAFVFGLLSVFLLPAPLALLTSLAGAYDWHKRNRNQGMRGIAIGFVMGSIGTVCLILLLFS